MFPRWKRLMHELTRRAGLGPRWFSLQANVLEVRNLAMLKKAMG